MARPEFAAAIKSRLDIVDVIGADVELRRAGNGEHTGLCPFHSESTPSFSVSDRKQLYNCFGCGAKGDVVAYAMRRHACDFVSALRLLGPLAGVDVPGTWEGKAPAVLETNRVVVRDGPVPWGAEQALSGALLAFQINYPGSPAEEYMLGRGLVAPEAGWIPDDCPSVLAHINQKWTTALGLTVEGRLSPGFAGRVVMPYTWGGRITALQARALDDSKPKYRMTHIHWASESGDPVNIEDRWERGVYGELALERSVATLCEGWPDALALEALGATGNFAVGGVNFSAKVLARLAALDVCYLASDNDDTAAPLEARLRAAGVNVRRHAPPDGHKDWADYLVGFSDNQASARATAGPSGPSE